MAHLKKFIGKVIENNFINHNVIVMKIKSPDDFSFKAGQFVNVKITKDDKTKHTAYSILNPPKEKGEVHLCLDIIEGGFASPWLKDIKEGEEMELSGPFGNLIFDEKINSKEHWFIGTGTGVVPLYSLIKEKLSQFPDKKFKLIFGARKKEDLLFHEEFKKMELDNDNFSYLPTITREEWDGKTGRVQQHLGDDLQDKTFYICGLKEMVTETRELLMKKGVPAININFERYT